MRSVFNLKHVLAAFVLALTLAFALPTTAQQINPTAESVKEQQLLNALKGGGGQVQGRVSIPDVKSSTLIQPGGKEWRDFHQNTMTTIGAVAIFGILALLVLFYLVRGRIKIGAGPSGRTITRFGSFDRFTHWLTAGCFIVLALSGLNITFGKTILLPLIGPQAFTNLSIAAKWSHNYLAWPFMIGLALMFLLWVKDNIPNAGDLAWFKAGGGLVGKGHPAAKRFNGGQKVVFWMVIIGGAALSVSGIYLLFPYTAGGVANLQFWNIVHGVVSLLLIAAMFAHIYIGSIGMEGAFDAMGSGEVDLNWAREHHSLWVADEMKKGAAVSGGRLQAAE
ncbi:MAG: formate dehydrogenase subunit gamma [Bosea sp. (in: a-proteobacteria)]